VSVAWPADRRFNVGCFCIDAFTPTFIANGYAVQFGSGPAIETRSEWSSTRAQFRFWWFLSFRQPLFGSWQIVHHGHLPCELKRVGLRGIPSTALSQQLTRVGLPFMVFFARRSSLLSGWLHPQAQITVWHKASLQCCVRNLSEAVVTCFPFRKRTICFV